jgi:hypothetical protein
MSDHHRARDGVLSPISAEHLTEIEQKIADLTRLADELRRINGRCQSGGGLSSIARLSKLYPRRLATAPHDVRSDFKRQRGELLHVQSASLSPQSNDPQRQTGPRRRSARYSVTRAAGTGSIIAIRDVAKSFMATKIERWRKPIINGTSRIICG